MKEANATIVEAPQTQAMTVRPAQGVGKALSVDELKANLEYIKTIMQSVMREGQDYGKIPGTGEKPTLLQPGAQKLMMTFQLEEEVKKEVLREYPGWHREYEFTITVKSQTGKTWDGVGTCSTLEKKYAKRRASRKCPTCGKPTILKSKKGRPEFFCWGKKGGCGAHFELTDARIINQEEGESDNPDIPDTWNTVRKMGFKRGLVAAVINATNTSELWTQDMEENKEPQEEGEDRGTHVDKTPSRASAASPAKDKKLPLATAETRRKMLDTLKQANFADQELLAFFIDASILMPNESLADIPLRWVPISLGQMTKLKSALLSYQKDSKAVKPYEANPEQMTANAPKEKANDSKPIEVPRDPNTDPDSPDAPWRSFPVPYGRDAGVQLADLDKNKLFGWWANFEVEERWKGDDGQWRDTKPEKVEQQRKFREMLDEAGKHYEFKTSEQLEEEREIEGGDYQ